MEPIKEFAKRKVEEWWDSVQRLMQKVKSWRDLASERLHPCLRLPLLALMDAANSCVFGIGLLCLISVGLFLLCSFMLLMMAPFLLVASWLSSYLLPPVKEPFHPSLLLRHTIFILASIVLIGLLYLLNNRVKKRNPESNLTDFLSSCLEGLPIVPWIAISYALWIIISGCCVVFTFDFTLAVGWGFIAVSYLLYYFFLFCLLLLGHIPWFVLLPLTVFLPLFIISLFRRFSSDQNQDDDDDDPEQRITPHGTSYGTLRPTCSTLDDTTTTIAWTEQTDNG